MAAGAEPGEELGDIRRRQDLDLPPGAQRHLAGRRAAHRPRRRLHLQLHHRQQDGQLPHLHRVHPEGGRRRRLHGADHLQPAQGEHARAVDPHRARAHLEVHRPEEGERDLPELPADRRQRAVSGRGVQEVELRPAGRQQEVLSWRPQERPADLPDVPERRHDDPGHEGGHAWQPAGASRRRSSSPLGTRPGIVLDAYTPIGFDQLGFNCYEGPTSLGNPVLRDARFRGRPQLGRRQAEDREHRIRRLRRGGQHHHPAGHVHDPDWHWQPPAGIGLHVRPGRAPRPSWTPPATRTPTATASATTRASRSSCASGRARSRRPARGPASCWPAGSARWG